MKITTIGRQLVGVAFLLFLISTNARGQFVFDVTDSTSSGEDNLLRSVSCFGENCTACGLNVAQKQVNIIFKRTTDGGRTWKTQLSGFPAQCCENQNLLYTVDQIDSLHAVAVGDTALIMRTNDGGMTWSRQSCPTRSVLFDVDFSDSLTGIAVGTRPPVILTTSDGGVKWNVATIAGKDFYSCHSYGGGMFRAFAYGSGPVYTTHDWWHSIDTGQLIPDSVVGSPDYPVFAGCRFIGGDTIIAYGNLLHVRKDSTYIAWGLVVRSIDAGKHWESFFSDSSFRTLTRLSAAFHDTILAGGNLRTPGKFLLSADAGMSWHEDTLLFSSPAAANAVGGVSFLSDGSVIGLFGQDFLGSNSFIGRGNAVFSRVEAYERIVYGTHIYPNPSSGRVIITSVDQLRPVKLIDVLGREVLRDVLDARGQATLNLSLLPRGIYSVMLDHYGKNLPVGKIVVSGKQ
jgi:photosystem II stability/assembly factor-like uncharacterized protein